MISNGAAGDLSSSTPHRSRFGSFVEDKKDKTVYAVCVARLKSYYRYTTITLHPFSLKSREGKKWSDMIAMGLLPSYWDLLRFESKALFGTPSPDDDEVGRSSSFGYAFSVVGACCLAVVPIGHLTLPGTTAAAEVVSRFKHFFLALMGRWTAEVVEAYDVKGQVDRMAVDVGEDEYRDMNRINTRFSHVLETTIGPRAILLQLVPWLTIWSVFSIATSGSAMWARQDSGLLGDSVKGETKLAKKKGKKKGKIETMEGEGEAPGSPETSQGPGDATPPSSDLLFPSFIWYSDAFARAGAEDKGRWKHRRWMMHIAAIRTIVLHSRAIQYLVSAYTTFVSVWVLFYPANKAVLASIVVILGPVALVQALGLVLILGKALNVKDMADIGSPGQIEQNILTLKVKEKKTKEEIREVLLVPPKKRELKVEEDDYDYCDEAEDDEVEDKHGDVEMTTREPHISVSEVVLRDSIGPAFAPARQSLAPYAEFGTALEKQPSVLARHSNFSAAHGRIRIHHSQAHHDQHHSLPLGATVPAVESGAQAEPARGQQRVLHIQKRLSPSSSAAPILQGSALQGIARLPPGGPHQNDSAGIADSAAVSPIHEGPQRNNQRPSSSLSISGEGPVRKIKISAPTLKSLPLPHDKDSSR